MLYERWRKISAERRNEFALRDFASGQTLDVRRTFHRRRKTKIRRGRHGLFHKAIRRNLFLICSPRGVKIKSPARSKPGNRRRNSRAAKKLRSSQIHLGHRRRGAVRRFHRGTTHGRCGKHRCHHGLARGLAESRRHFAGAFVRIFQFGFAAVVAWHSADPRARAVAGNHPARGAKMNPVSRSPPCPRCGARGTRRRRSRQNVRLAISAGAPLPVNLEQDIFKSSRPQNP